MLEIELPRPDVLPPHIGAYARADVDPIENQGLAANFDLASLAQSNPQIHVLSASERRIESANLAEYAR